jgi:hypothetical protein
VGELVEAGRRGRLAALEVLRDRLMAEIETQPRPSEVAALAARLVVILEQIEAVRKAEGTDVDSIDDLAAKRSARRATSARKGRARKDVVNGGP